MSESEVLTNRSIEAASRLRANDLEAIIGVLKDQGSPKNDYTELESELASLKQNFSSSNLKETREKGHDLPFTTGSETTTLPSYVSNKSQPVIQGCMELIESQKASLIELEQEREYYAAHDELADFRNQIIKKIEEAKRNLKISQAELRLRLMGLKEERAKELTGLFAVYKELHIPEEDYKTLSEELQNLSKTKG